MTASISWERVKLGRLAGQHLLWRKRPAQLLDVVSDLCGLHAQVMSSADLSAALRIDGLARDAVRQSLWTDRTLVKTWTVRGTLHLVPAREYPLWVSAAATRQYWVGKTWLDYLGLTADLVNRVTDAVTTALDGRILTRDELGREVGRVTGDSDLEERLRSGWGSLLKPAAYQGRLCFAPSEGNRVRFVRPDQWLADQSAGDAAPEPWAALQELARRFLAAYGPATSAEFASWWGTTTGAARELFATMADLVPLELERKPTFTTRQALQRRPRRSSTPVVRLLPRFDPYTVSVRRNGVRPMAEADRPLVYRKAGWISAVVLVDGEVSGVWEHRTGRTGLQIMVRPFDRLTDEAQEGILTEGIRLSARLGMDGAAVEIVGP